MSHPTVALVRPLFLYGSLVLWGLLLLAGLAAPLLGPAKEVGDLRIRCTIRLTLLYYGLAAAVLLSAPAAEDRTRLARCLWSLAWSAYAIHVALAFHYYHHWSHTDAFDRTERLTGFGPGLYVSYLFTLLWTLDVACWWLCPRARAARPAWLDGLLHSFLAFIVFNGAVVFAQGLVRWASLALFAVLGLLLARRYLGFGRAAPLRQETLPRYQDSSGPPALSV